MPGAMIEVAALTKQFPAVTAVDNISFEVPEGEIVGFLGPNAAGKTTTMRILTGFMPATSGKARVAGYDVFEQSLEARRNVGYLPENVPLYGEMRVSEYLAFRARLQGVPRKAMKDRISSVMERCGVVEVKRDVIGRLSKGYRQRVGLAGAIVHDPKILILDEPTLGLDPNQVRQVRALIRELGQKHTILLSTHILPEVEMVCSRVIIINEGKIVTEETMDNLKARFRKGAAITLEVAGPGEQIKAALEKVPGVRKVAWQEKGPRHSFVVEPSEGKDVREEVFKTVTGRGWVMTEMSTRRTSLEDIFARVTAAEER